MSAPGALAGAQIAGGLASGIASFAAGDAAAEAGRRANQQAQINAQLLEDLGVLRAADIRRERGRIMGTRRTAFAKGGVNPNTGTALDVLLDASTEDELAALNAKFGFDSQAFQQRVQGANAEFAGLQQQNALNAQGFNAIAGSVVSAGTTFTLLSPKASGFTFDSTLTNSQLQQTIGGRPLLDLNPTTGGLTRMIT